MRAQLTSVATLAALVVGGSQTWPESVERLARAPPMSQALPLADVTVTRPVGRVTLDQPELRPAGWSAGAGCVPRVGSRVTERADGVSAPGREPPLREEVAA